MSKQRVLIIGDSPFIHTGFGYLTREIGKILNDNGHTVAHIALWDKRKDSTNITLNGITIPWKVYSCKTDDFGLFARTQFTPILSEFRPTLILIITDI